MQITDLRKYCYGRATACAANNKARNTMPYLVGSDVRTTIEPEMRCFFEIALSRGSVKARNVKARNVKAKKNETFSEYTGGRTIAVAGNRLFILASNAFVHARLRIPSKRASTVENRQRRKASKSRRWLLPSGLARFGNYAA